MKNMLVAQSGGPSAAINATITGVIDAGIASDQVGHVYGARNGIKGVLNENFVNLQDYDFIAASFTRTAEDIMEIRKILQEHGGEKIHIIAKLENKQGVKNCEDILRVADGIMIARGDMGVEIDPQGNAYGKTGDHSYTDAGFHDEESKTDESGDLGCCQCDLSGNQCDHAVRRDCSRCLSDRSSTDYGEDCGTYRTGY